MQRFWDRINFYGTLSAESRNAWEQIVKKRVYKKGELFLSEGQLPKMVAFVAEGLFSQYYCTPEGDTVIKKFFPENHMVASTSALLKKEPGMFTIKALETSTVFEYNFYSFKELAEKYADIAAFYTKYLELHWVIEKEPLEISYRHDSAKTRYINFLNSYPTLEPRLKQHEIASYLGITPTQLSRIRAGI